MSVKLIDVIKLVNVSPTAVSRVINNYGYISEKTCKKVFSAMNEPNHQPNSLARPLQREKARLIGATTPSLTSPFFAKLVSRIKKLFNRKDCKLIPCNAVQGSSHEERDYLSMLKVSQADGIISGTHNLGITEYQEVGLSIVSFGRNLDPDVPVVSSDNYRGGWVTTNGLINLGYKEVVFLGDTKGSSNPADSRPKGYHGIIIEHGLQEILVPTNFYESANLKEMVFQKLFSKHEIDGAFSTGDFSANLSWQYSRFNHLKDCERIEVIGYDGTSIMQQFNPDLSTTAQPTEEIANLLVDLLIKRIGHEELSDSSCILPIILMKGNSI